MANTNPARAASNRIAKFASSEILVERQSPEAARKLDSNAANSQQGVPPQDRSFASIHTGDRATHEPASMPETDVSVAPGGTISAASLGALIADLPDYHTDSRRGEAPLAQTGIPQTPALTPAIASVVAAREIPAPSDVTQTGANVMRLGPMGDGSGASRPHNISGEHSTASQSPAPLPTVRAGEGAGGSAPVPAIAEGQSNAGITPPTTDPVPRHEPAVIPPALSVLPAAGLEDQPIPLNIAANLTVADGTDTLAITIEGVPEGATLSAGTQNPDGSWTLTADQLANLTLTPAPDSSEDFILVVTATASDMPTGAEASTTASFPVIVDAVLDPPVLAAEATAGLEDTAIPLAISVEPRDGIAESDISIVIAGLPEGATFSAGAPQSDGSWLLAADQLGGLLLTPPQDFQGDIQLTVTAISRDANGAEASAQTQATVHVGSVTDAPIVTVQDATGQEDSPIALSIAGISGDLTGVDILSPFVSIAGVPEGAALSAGTRDVDGTWSVALDELAGLSIIPPADSDENFTLSVTFTATDPFGNTAETTAPLTVVVEAVPDLPTVSVEPASGDEDSFIPLNIAAVPNDTDGSQSLSFTISGIPAGAVLSAGTDLGGGVWSVEPDQLASLAIRPPADFSGEIPLTLAAVALESTGASAATTVEFGVQVGGVADPALIIAADAVGFAEGPLPLSISAELTDRDGSETLGPITISGLPEGAILSAGTENPDGTWTLDASQLEGLTLTPPPGDSSDFTLRVEVITIEANGASTSTGVDLGVQVAALPDLTAIMPVSGTEDAAVALDFAGVLDGLGPGETLTVTVFGLPEGAVLSAGTQNPDGTWTLTGDQLAGLTLTPPQDFAGDIRLDLALTTQVGDISTTQTATLDVHIAPVPDVPSAAVSDAAGTEDTSIPLDIAVALNPADSAGELMVAITGVPDGASLSTGTLNPNGEWILSADQLSGLTFIPAPDASGAYTLTVTPIALGEGDLITPGEPMPLVVEVLGEADTPDLTAPAATGLEDQPIALDIAASLNDLDGSEALTVTVAGLPEGATLSAGTQNQDGTWTLTDDELAGLTLTPPQDFAGDFSLTVTATARETLSGNEASTTIAVPVTIQGVADAPTLAVSSSAGAEDQPIALDITAALDTPSATETLAVAIGGLPEGATLSAGTLNADGTYTLTADELVGLTVAPPADSSDDFNLTVTAAAYDSATGTEATRSAILPVTVSGIADAPILAGDAATGLEDMAIPLDISAALTDIDGSETLIVTVAGLSEGAVLSAGTQNVDGTWTLSPSDLANLTVTPPENSSEDFTLTVTATAVETATGNEASTTVSIPVTVEPVVDIPTLLSTPATGLEDTAIALDIAAGLVEPTSSETLSVLVEGLPEGATLSAGTQNPDGTWALTGDDLAGLMVTPAPDSSEDFTLTVTAIATDSITGATASTTTTVPVTVIDVVDAPNLLAVPVTGLEDTAIALDISAGLVAPSVSETLTVTVDGLPEGATLSAGTLNADSTYTLTGDDLAGLTVTPAPDSSEGFSLTVTATATDSITGVTASTTTTVPVTVIDVIDAPSLLAAPATGLEDAAIALDLTAGLVAPNGSETLTVIVDGLPEGATLSAGILNGDGTYTLTNDELAGLTVTPAPNSNEDFTLTVTATTTDGITGAAASTTATVPVTVIDVVDAPSLLTVPAIGLEDTAITLNLTAVLVAPSGSETLIVTIDGLPEGATLSAGTLNADSTYTLTASQLTGLTVTPAPSSSEDFELTVTATTTDSITGTAASTTTTVPVTVIDVIDTPSLLAVPVTGLEDTAIALDISAGLVAPSTSETLTVTIDGLPEGTALSAGIQNSDGTYTLTSADLIGLTVTPAPNSSEDFSLTVTANATDSITGATASTTTTVAVTVIDVVDAPTLLSAPITGLQDTAIPLDITAGLVAPSLSETLAVTVDGLPVGATLSAGIQNADGTWTLTGDELVGLTLTPAPGSGEDFTLTVTATATDGVTGATASTTTDVPVTVIDAIEAPTLTLTPVVGLEDQAIPLAIDGALSAFGSDATLTITSVPEDSTLSAGVLNADGTWTVSGDSIGSLTLTPPENFSGDLQLSVTATGTLIDGSIATVTAPLDVSVLPVADEPIVSAIDAAGTTGEPIALDLSAALTDTDGSEQLALLIAGLPGGTTLSAGVDNGNGTWSLTADDLNGLTLTSADTPWSLPLTLMATATETDGSTAATVVPFVVSVADPIVEAIPLDTLPKTI